MQSALFEPQTLPELPDVGILDRWVYESPFPLIFICLAIALLIFGALRHTKHAKRIAYPSLAVGCALGVAIYTASQLVTTDIEHLKERSSRLVIAASIGDSAALESLLDQSVRIQAPFVSQAGKARVITLAQSRAAPMIDSASDKKINAGLYGDQVARTQIKVRVNADMLPPTSWWAVDWKKASPDSDQWVVTHIESIWIQGISN